MNRESRETLNRATGILEGLSVSEKLTDAETNLIISVSKMIYAVLQNEDTE